MGRPIQEIATSLLLLLAKMRATVQGRGEVDGPTLQEITSLSPPDLNDAVSLLQRSGYAEWIQTLGTGPFNFALVWITPIGRYEAERVESLNAQSPPPAPGQQSKEATSGAGIVLPPTPIGSPYGFTDEDWEFIAQQRDQGTELTVVMGYQFASAHYDSGLLRSNVQAMFEQAVRRYNALSGALQTTLQFRPLAAGYGEHLFNEIARDIIASDIAVFETSDLNPNVMVELGVALTWGVRVLPIKVRSQPRPPSDISGQTWADYDKNGERFVDPEHIDKVVRMVERAMRKKGRR